MPGDTSAAARARSEAPASPAKAEIGAASVPSRPRQDDARVRGAHRGASGDFFEGRKHEAPSEHLTVRETPDRLRRIATRRILLETNTNRPAAAWTRRRVVSPFSSLSKRIEISHVCPKTKCQRAGPAPRAAGERKGARRRDGRAPARQRSASAFQTFPSMNVWTIHRSSRSRFASPSRMLERARRAGPPSCTAGRTRSGRRRCRRPRGRARRAGCPSRRAARG